MRNATPQRDAQVRIDFLHDTKPKPISLKLTPPKVDNFPRIGKVHDPRSFTEASDQALAG